MTQIPRAEWMGILREFEDQPIDWIDVGTLSSPSEAETRRQVVFRFLCDKGLVTEQSKRSFMDGHGLPKTKDGRYLTSEVTYRITAKGREQLRPWYENALGNVRENLPTYFASVLTALLIAWLSQKLGLNQ